MMHHDVVALPPSLWVLSEKKLLRYLQKEIASVSRKKLQLVGVACMLIAAKYATF